MGTQAGSRRLLPFAPYAALIVAWRLHYGFLGFGVAGTLLYIDPADGPCLFLGALAERIPLLLGAQALLLPVDVWFLLPRRTQLGAAAVSAILLAGLLSAFWKALRREPLARFWALGTVLSLVPFCTTYPQGRLLTFSSIGACGLLASCGEATGIWPWRSGGSGWRRWPELMLLALHGPVAAVLMPFRVGAIHLLAAVTSAPSRRAPRGPEVAGQTFVFLNGNDLQLAYLQIVRTAQGDAPLPGRMALLSLLSTSSRVRRTDDRTLVISTELGWFEYAVDRVALDPRRKFSVGERIHRPDYVAEIRSTTRDARPLEVAFRFHEPLERLDLRWLYWRDGRLVAFPLPGVEVCVSVPIGT